MKTLPLFLLMIGFLLNWNPAKTIPKSKVDWNYNILDENPVFYSGYDGPHSFYESPTPYYAPAFPGAVGFGANFTFSSNYETRIVTNFNYTGSGSLNNAMTASTSASAILIVFNGRSGAITTTGAMSSLSGKQMYVAGQTSTNGVMVRRASNSNGTLMSNSSGATGAIIRGLTLAVGGGAFANNNGDNFAASGSNGVVVDHCALFFSNDESFQSWGNSNVTLQNSIIAYSLYNSTHTDSNGNLEDHSKADLIGNGSTRNTRYRNIYANNDDRNPLIGGNPNPGSDHELVQNIVYNWWHFGTVISNTSSGNQRVNVINNVHIDGPNTSTARRSIAIVNNSTLKIHANGNINPEKPSAGGDEWNAIGCVSGCGASYMEGSGATLKSQSYVSTPHSFPLAGTSILTKSALKSALLSTGGSGTFNRSALENSIITQVTNESGGDIIDSPSEVGGWPTFASSSAISDSDNDGIPNDQESNYGNDTYSYVNDLADGTVGGGGGPIAVTGVSVTPDTPTIAIGGTVQLTETVVPTNADDKGVTWDSDTPSIATVNSTGLVTGVSAGTADVTVTTDDGGFTATSSVTVSAGGGGGGGPIVGDRIVYLDQLTAFPGAVGHGRSINPGRGGNVIFVTNLNNSGAGSLRAALQATGNRTIIFRVGGTITYGGTNYSVIPYGSGDVYVAGQTAPGDGILIKGAEFRVIDDNVLLRNFRIRMGDNVSGTSQEDGLAFRSYSGNTLSGAYADHISVSWSNDENLNIGAIGASPGSGGSYSDVTIANCIFAENIGAGYTSLLWQNTNDITYYQNLLTKGRNRNIRASTSNSSFEMINNHIYDYTHGTQATYENYFDIIGNVWNLAGQTLTPGSVIKIETCSSTNCPGGANVALTRAYISDNNFNGSSGWESELTPYLQGAPVVESNIVAYPVAGVLDSVNLNAGAYNGLAQGLDAIDVEFLANAYSDSRDAKRSSAPDGIYPTIAGGTPYTDNDGDGMDDDWETYNGLNPADASDRNTRPVRVKFDMGTYDLYVDQALVENYTTEGYTALELWLSYLADDYSKLPQEAISAGTVNVTDVVVTPSSDTIEEGETTQLSVTINPTEATVQTGVWSSDTPGVATVSQTGLVTGVSAGSATITFTSDDTSGTYDDNCSITVTAAPTPPPTSPNLVIPVSLIIGGETFNYYIRDGVVEYMYKNQDQNQAEPPVSTAPVIEAFTLGSDRSGTSGVVNKPSGVQVGDLLVILAMLEEDGDGTIFNSLSGWTKEFEYGDTTADARIAMYWRIATGSEAASEDVTATAACYGKSWYLRISGADGTTPIHLVGSENEGNANSLEASSITTTSNNTLVIAMFSCDGGDMYPFTISGSGWPTTFETDQQAYDGTFPGAWSGGWTYKTMPTAGATGNVIFTASQADGFETIQFAIEPD